MKSRFPLLCASAILLLAGHARAAWMDAAWPFRREISLGSDAEKMTGGELAMATFLANGKQKDDGSDLRVATEEGKPIPSRVLGVGPGDLVRIAFAPTRAARRYFVYWGNPNPPKKTDDLPITSGVLMEMRVWPGGQPDTAQHMISGFDRARAPIGTTMVDRIFIGRNPFDERTPWITRFTASLYIPQDGDYVFAAAAKDRGLLVLDGKQLILCLMTTHARFTANARLTKGRHEVVFYHMNHAGEGLVSLSWKKPGATGFEPISSESFGRLITTIPGAMEEARKTLTADFKVDYIGEAFFAGLYTHHYRFTANLPTPPRLQPPRYEWDFGDGQTAEGNVIDHVYLAHGVYPVKVTARIASNSDTQTSRIGVARDYMSERIRLDEAGAQSKLVENYKLGTLTPSLLPAAVLLHQRSGRYDAMLQAAAKLAVTPTGYDPFQGLSAMHEATHAALNNGRIDAMLKIWDSIPANSSMQPSASREYAKLLIWRAADFDKACRILAGQGSGTDRGLQVLYAQALILNKKYEEGKKILQSLKLEGPAAIQPERQAALSGAMARTVEYYIESGDPETGEETWEKWQRQHPAEFLEGYSALLRVRLIEARKMPEVAAKIAEAFATAVPRSSYAPSLLDKASKLLAKSNPTKSADLRKILKQKYPEDPLSQEK